MCISKRKKWGEFKPSPAYLRAVEGLTTVAKLHKYLKQFEPKAEKGWNDYWKTPIEFIENKDEPNDCEDFSRFAVDVLHRILNIKGARFIIQSGYNIKMWGKWIWNMKCHAICVFPYQGKFGVFSNNQLYIGINSIEDAGKILFVDGLKSQVVYDWQGKVLSRRFKVIGTF